MRHRPIATVLAGAAAIVSCAAPAAAQSAERRNYDLPAQPLGSALRVLSSQSGTNILAAAELIGGRQAPALKGNFTLEEALRALLAGSGLRARAAGVTFIVELDPAQTAALPSIEPDILITGSRIRGGTVASPVITISRDDARNAGQATLGEVARSIPQSFGGGQNPGIGFNVPTASGVDVGGGSSINLRGLGSDATLTLLNGHRLAYSGSRQSVDVSTIPLGALDRIEIVADGASALYGSDAVGGVANIILRRDMDGVETSARIGGATEGGDVQQQYDITAGKRWSRGGFIAAYEFNRVTAIDSKDRDFAADRSPGLRLLPATRNNNVLISAHQDLTNALTFAVDGLYNQRSTFFVYPQDATGDLSIARAEQTTDEKAYVVATSLSWALGRGTHVDLSGTYAQDQVDYRTVLITPAATTQLVKGCYCNRTFSVELSGDGRLFRLPGGWAKLALGAGYRSTDLRSDRGAGNIQNFDRSIASTYGYAELDLPMLAPGAEGGMRLDLNAAVRYERYRTIGSVATPKLGIVWSPIPGIDIKASGDRSYRAPTLLQRYQPVIATLYPAASLGGAGFPTGSTALYFQGGSPTLRPERASSWSLGVDLHPATLRGFDFQLSYFSTSYVDRIVAPIGFTSQSLNSPLYAAYVTRLPSQAAVAAVVANAALFQKTGGAIYDPAKVIAIVDNSNVNAGSQPVHGLDALLTYHTNLSARDTLTLNGNASYLVSSRQISPDQPVTPLAGILFNPPHWRARGSVGWQRDGFGLTSTLSYMGDLSDTRATPALRIPGQATLDVAVRYKTPASAPLLLRGLDVILAVQNVLDATPPPIAIASVGEAPYDTTNYSPVGRFLSLTIARKW